MAMEFRPIRPSFRGPNLNTLMNDIFEFANTRFLQVYVMYDKIPFCPEFERFDNANGDCSISSGPHFISQDFGHHS